MRNRVLLATLSRALLLCLAFSVADLRAATGRRVALRASDGASVAGSYYEPARRPAPGIVMLPMLRRGHEDWDATASRLAEAGFAVLALDYRSSEGELGALALDARAAKAFLKERSEVNPTLIGVVGASVGANLALLDAADDPTVRSVALLSPGLDYKGLRIEAAMKKYGARPALLLASTKDPYAWRSVRVLEGIGPGTREVRLSDDVAHGTMLLARDPELISTLVDWFKRTLL